MPTYEYVCEKCQHTFEVFQSMKDEPLKVCPKDKCSQKRWGKGKVRRLLGAGGGLIFKGSGFYITDYRSESYKAAAKKEASPSSSSTTGSSASASSGSSSSGSNSSGSGGKSGGGGSKT